MVRGAFRIFAVVAAFSSMKPSRFADYPAAIIAYVNNTRGDVNGMRQMLTKRGALRSTVDLLEVDPDADGEGELLLIVVDPSYGYGLDLPGDLLVLDLEHQKYRLA